MSMAGQATAGRGSSGKRDFGSFHSSNVEELLRIPEDEYKPPALPVDLPVFTGELRFGVNAKQEHFLLDEAWTFINHGAFGAVLKHALTAATAWQVYCERQPLKFLDRELLPLLVFITRQLAKFIDAAPCDVVLVPNVTTGVNTVVQSVCQTYSSQDTVLIFNTTYGPVKRLVHHVSSNRGFAVQELNIHFPLSSSSELMDILEQGLRLHGSVRLVIIDHISSNYGIIFPVKEMVALCHSRGVQVLVDGAHALGSLPISMRDIGADYYTSNAHKWLCNPKGCGFLYVDPSHQDSVQPLVVSHGYNSGFCSSFIWSGLRDYSPFLALHTVLSFWHHYGADDIRRYIHTTAREAGEGLVHDWGTELLAEASMCGPMVLVALPQGALRDRGPYSYQHAETVQNILYHNFHIEVPVKAIQGKLYVRISAHIYNMPHDYKALSAAVIDMTTTVTG